MPLAPDEYGGTKFRKLLQCQNAILHLIAIPKYETLFKFFCNASQKRWCDISPTKQLVNQACWCHDAQLNDTQQNDTQNHNTLAECHSTTYRD